MWGYLTESWLILAILSAIFSALMVFVSGKTLENAHNSVVMFFRLVGGMAITVPILIIIVNQGKTGISWQSGFLSWASIVLVGLFAGIAWYTFYEAMQVGAKYGVSSSTVAAINTTYVAMLLFLSWIFKDDPPNLRQMIGVVLIVIGAAMVTLKKHSDPNVSPQTEQPFVNERVR